MPKYLLPLCAIISVFTCLEAKNPPRKAVQARHGMVVSAEGLASRVGRDILKKGGNAVDAAVATGFALAVTFPQAGNIGGGGYMVIRMASGKTTTFDFREKAPGKATRDMYLDSTGRFVSAGSEHGYLSVGVPGSVAGLLDALAKYGTMKREQVLAPAIALAERGFPVGAGMARVMKEKIDAFNCYGGTKRTFTRKGKPYRRGEIFVQKDLAETLKRIASRGKEGFYRGKTARLIVQEMKLGGGLITLEDLKNYAAIERPPVTGTYRGYEIVSMGPSSSGGIILIELLNMLERYDVAAGGFGTPHTIALMAETMKFAYADRAEYLGDEDFYPVPIATLISKDYAASRAALIDTAKAAPASTIAHGIIPHVEGVHTTHYSVVDRWGNAVSTTTTINSWFGSGVVVSGAGFFLNNEMDDFSAKPGTPNQFGLIGGVANAIQPNKRMLSAMTPTIVLKDQKPVLVVGSPGGSTIITTVLQVILNVIDHRMNVQDAVNAMRVHDQWYPDSLYYEHESLRPRVIDELKSRGYATAERAGNQGEVEAIAVDGKKKMLYGAADPRGHGTAAGY
ncbi:MAG TPA: gamma-glutamyltransferase [Bacteroidota bacterium]|nr:gamma-glutamyltransferase [Bacteroidota bacterium]